MQPKSEGLLAEVEVQTSSEQVHGSPEPWVGECIDACHPTLVGRLLVRLALANGDTIERWMPALHGLSVRPSDRVLLLRPANWAEAIVVGVVDGFARRPEVAKLARAALTLKPDESLRIEADNGAALVELFQGECGPVVRLLNEDTDVELAGKLRVSARTIELIAREGEARVEASADVVVRGENINLN